MVIPPPSTGPRWKRAAIIAAVALAGAAVFCVLGTVISSMISGNRDTGTPPPNPSPTAATAAAGAVSVEVTEPVRLT